MRVSVLPDFAAPESDAAQRPLWRRNLRLYPLFYFFHDFQLWLSLWIVFIVEDVGLSYAELGYIAPAFYVISSFGQAPAGALADRFGRVRTIRLSLLIYIVFIVWFAFSGGVWEAAIAWSLWGVAMVMLTGTDSAFLHDSLQALGRSREFELQAGRAFAVRSVAIVGATFAGGPIAGELGAQATVLLGAGATALSLVVSMGFREPPRLQTADGQTPRYLDLIREALSLCRRNPSVRYALLFAAVLMAAMVPEFYLLQPFLREHGVEVGWLFTALQAPGRIAAVIGAVAAFSLASRFGALKAAAAMPLLVVIAWAGIAAVNHLGAIALFVVVGFVRGALTPLIEGYLNRRTPSHLRATMLSLNHMGWALFMLGFLPNAGRVLDSTPLPTVFAGLAVIFGVLMVVASLLWVRADRRERSRLRIRWDFLRGEGVWKQQQPARRPGIVGD